MAYDENEQRLWSIDSKSDQQGLPLWPIVAICVVGAFLIGALLVPCIGLRIDYLRHSTDTQMSVFKMRCEKEGKGCVCRQDAGVVQGGPNCELRRDLKPKCVTPPADQLKQRRP